MLAVIILTMLTVAIGVLLSYFFNPEQLTKSRITDLASDYYENYLYEQLINSENFSGDLDATMSRYNSNGFNPVTLRQLILHDQTATANIADSLRDNCDEELTTVTFYPDPPYARNNYHIDYHYVCNF